MIAKELRKLKRFWVVNPENVTEFEAEKFGDIWVVWNYGRDDFNSILVLNEDEMEEFIKNRKREGRFIQPYVP